LHSSFIMGRMAYAADLAGASGIRANSVEDIQEIKKTVDLPIIGIIKSVYDGYDVSITPTMNEIDALYNEGVDMIALDATARIRPDDTTIDEIFHEIREKYAEHLFMADRGTYEETINGAQLRFDCFNKKIHRYTQCTK